MKTSNEAIRFESKSVESSDIVHSKLHEINAKTGKKVSYSSNSSMKTEILKINDSVSFGFIKEFYGLS